MILGLTGYKGVGKTTASDYLIEKHGFIRHNFKDSLIAEIKQNFPDLLQEILKREYSEGHGIVDIDDLFRVKPPLMRTLMQNYGTEVRRKDNTNYWTDKWKQRLRLLSVIEPGKHIVVDDCRFLNEAEAIKKMGGIIVRLTRPDIADGGTHVSETEQNAIAYDYTMECPQGQPEAIHAELDKLVV